jgi:hypothetical protein
VRRLRLRVDRRGLLFSSGRVLDTRDRTLREDLAGLGVRARVREWLRALAVRCTRRGRFRQERGVREDLDLLRDRALVADRDDLGLGIGRELLRAG